LLISSERLALKYFFATMGEERWRQIPSIILTLSPPPPLPSPPFPPSLSLLLYLFLFLFFLFTSLSISVSLPNQIARMEHGQKHNHMPGWNRLNHKGVLGEMAESLRSKGCGLALNVPKTWVLPQHASLLTKDAQSGGGPYILKPVGGTRGKGIRLAKRMSAEDVAQIRGKWVCQVVNPPPHHPIKSQSRVDPKP